MELTLISLSSTESVLVPLEFVPEPDNFGWRAYCESMLAIGILHATTAAQAKMAWMQSSSRRTFLTSALRGTVPR